jgi:hypothetical protein
MSCITGQVQVGQRTSFLVVFTILQLGKGTGKQADGFSRKLHNFANRNLTLQLGQITKAKTKFKSTIGFK